MNQGSTKASNALNRGIKEAEKQAMHETEESKKQTNKLSKKNKQ